MISTPHSLLQIINHKQLCLKFENLSVLVLDEIDSLVKKNSAMKSNVEKVLLNLNLNKTQLIGCSAFISADVLSFCTRHFKYWRNVFDNSFGKKTVINSAITHYLVFLKIEKPLSIQFPVSVLESSQIETMVQNAIATDAEESGPSTDYLLRNDWNCIDNPKKNNVTPLHLHTSSNDNNEYLIVQCVNEVIALNKIYEKSNIEIPDSVILRAIEVQYPCSQPEYPGILVFVKDKRSIPCISTEFCFMGVNNFWEFTSETNGRTKNMLLLNKNSSKSKNSFIISTEVAARGLDIPYISHVVNLNAPTDLGSYIHRSGRVGRLDCVIENNVGVYRTGKIFNIVRTIQQYQKYLKFANELKIDFEKICISV